MPNDDLDFDHETLVVTEERSALGPFLLGAAVGAAAALLLAPRTGRETREEVSRLLAGLSSGEAGGGADGLVDRARSRATGGLDRLRDAVEQQVDRVREAVDEGRVAAREAGDELRRHLDDAKAAYRAGRAGTPPPAPRERRLREEPRGEGEDVLLGEPTVEEESDLAR